MFKVTGFHVVAVAVVLGVVGFIKVQEMRIDKLKSSLETVTQTANEQGAAIKQLKLDYARLNALDVQRKESKAEVQQKDVKLKKDSARKDVVAAKPGLVEKQINASFDKFALELQELTR